MMFDETQDGWSPASTEKGALPSTDKAGNEQGMSSLTCNAPEITDSDGEDDPGCPCCVIPWFR
ncbi:hypothetical protein AD939_01210 [Gluconobacter oxydans]|nr:hypothetical protein AD939_01210 [Gluconobacter oxydans]TCW20500.1 hypothetical protein EDC20_1553 [Gluconobacter oxydans]